jgi:hypothetical protein
MVSVAAGAISVDKTTQVRVRTELFIGTRVVLNTFRISRLTEHKVTDHLLSVRTLEYLGGGLVRVGDFVAHAKVVKNHRTVPDIPCEKPCFPALLLNRSFLPAALTTLYCVALYCLAPPSALAGDWVRPGLTTNQPIWGVRGGLQWAIAPAGFRGGEPRGLIRLGYPVLQDDRYDLINFIAIEPIVNGHRGFSELEHSQLDGVAGKRIWAEHPLNGARTNIISGQLRKLADGRETLETTLQVEKFENGAHVKLVIGQRQDKPDEIELSVFQQPDSAPLDYCILTATMGNMARTRRLWLEHEVVNSLELYRDYKDSGFAPHREYRLSSLHRTAEGGVLVAVTNDEADPKAIYPFPQSELWHYGGRKVTQYWSREPGTFRNDLRAIVNGRYTYWRSSTPVPGGVAYENFELQERFYNGQKFVFGITPRTPQEIGFKP